MKKLIYSLAIVSFMSVLTSCDKDLQEINIDPNKPVYAPTSGIFNSANKYLTDNTRGGFPSGRMLMPFAQMSSQREYNDEERYIIRTGTNNNYYKALQLSVARYKSLIDICEDPELAGKWAGSEKELPNQIAAARIMIAYAQLQLVGTYGDVVYYSYGSDDSDFQGHTKGEEVEYATPVFAPQEKIYKDLMKELKEASEQIDITLPRVMNGDAIFGTPIKMKRFANSLRLRIANRVKDVIPEAKDHIAELISGNVELMQSNADNVGLTYENNAINPAPYYSDAFVGNRNDFSPSDTFVNLIKGEVGPVKAVDPRLYTLLAPFGVPFYNNGDAKTIQNGEYVSLKDPKDLPLYRGVPYGVPSVLSQLQGALASQFGSRIYKADATEIYMEYAEVEFLLSENKGWDDSHFKAGVAASLDRYDIDEVEATAFLNALPKATMESVITQKYVGLYMQPEEAWAEYRRTGYPNTLILPGEKGWTIASEKEPSVEYTFTPGVVVNGIPERMTYPVELQSLNKVNLDAAISKLKDGDTMNSDLIFAKK